MDNLSTHILIVDDDREMRAFLSEQLSSRGFQISVASSGGEAIQMVRQGHFDLAICDFKMPIIDGISCMEAITHLKPDMSVIMMSGDATLDKAVSAMKKGAYDFLQKPLQMELLFSLIQKALLKNELESMAGLYKRRIGTPAQAKPGEVVEPMIKIVAAFFHADKACWMEVSGSGALSVLGSYALTDHPMREAMIATGERVLREAKEDKRSFLITDHLDGHSSACDSILVPLFRQNKPAAVVVLWRTASSKTFSLTELREVERFSQQILEAVESLKTLGSLDIPLNHAA